MDFALRAPDAEAVTLCLFESPDSAEAQRQVELRRGVDGVFRGRVDGLEPGALYGYRVEGPYAPHRGLRFNAAKLLVDPYARAITGEPRHHGSIFDFREAELPSLVANHEDSAGAMPKCVVIDTSFDWQGVTRPGIPWSETVIYECHVKGMTQRHPGVDAAARGRYPGLTSPAVLEHWRRLGITTIELMPVQQIASEKHLLAGGRRNYWGYSTLGYFAPHAGYGRCTSDPTSQVVEFKTMVRELHRAGFEVLLDVVFNHTAEGGAHGPTFSLRGIDNRGVYRLDPLALGQYVDVTGCGNSLDAQQPAVEELVLDCLRYWATDMRVDGFRFDLATTLGRRAEGFSADAPIFRAIADDPQLASLKWIAEPWDLGPGGYRLGEFPAPWRQWNDRYRLDVRRFWRGHGANVAQLARRLAGSDDVFGHRETTASLNYVVSHDGFTLLDLVSYAEKHNGANGEDNRDGSSDDSSCNWGHEGPTDDPQILALRRRHRRNLVATLAFSKGTPMLSQGDELGHSQGGNNNPYCQDNATTWLDWSSLSTAEGASWCRFVQRALALRRRFPVLRDLSFLQAEQVVWRRADGEPPQDDDWRDPRGCSVSLQWLARGNEDEHLLLLLHGGAEPQRFRLPTGPWKLWLNTADDDVREVPSAVKVGEVELLGRSLCLLSAGSCEDG